MFHEPGMAGGQLLLSCSWRIGSGDAETRAWVGLRSAPKTLHGRRVAFRRQLFPSQSQRWWVGGSSRAGTGDGWRAAPLSGAKVVDPVKRRPGLC
ncbi:hypothetical protein NDU88_006942 [Pleurodeles waltl]|uniref:Uncharacterized protein n=1 Tax=Pleurodeles waltl TaxID=8319 RepID=A0AAV7PKB8_PLEWA|nr:hypothetical protein NDU88_006942 [Pleurodeles waltl]